jgi:hypothetical protein
MFSVFYTGLSHVAFDIIFRVLLTNALRTIVKEAFITFTL